MIDARQIGREVGVRYVLEGSVQSCETRIRVNAQLKRSIARRARDRAYGEGKLGRGPAAAQTLAILRDLVRLPSLFVPFWLGCLLARR
jgi:hypothetical protein